MGHASWHFYPTKACCFNNDTHAHSFPAHYRPDLPIQGRWRSSSEDERVTAQIIQWGMSSKVSPTSTKEKYYKCWLHILDIIRGLQVSGYDLTCYHVSMAYVRETRRPRVKARHPIRAKQWKCSSWWETFVYGDPGISQLIEVQHKSAKSIWATCRWYPGLDVWPKFVTGHIITVNIKISSGWTK